MTDEQDFKIFISWSGLLAKGVAKALHAWLPTMFDHIDPWFSDTDIPAGTTWFGEIQERLDTSRYGIVIITTENLSKPWLNFEAGSLAKKLDQDRNRVTPVLVNFEHMNQLTGHPLQAYNAVLLDREGIRRLCLSIAQSAGRVPAHVETRFEDVWQRLEAAIEAAKNAAGDQPPPPEVSEPEQLTALTASIRSLESVVSQLSQGRADVTLGGLKEESDGADLLRRINAATGGRVAEYKVTVGDGPFTKVDMQVIGPTLDRREVEGVLDIFARSFNNNMVEITVFSDGNKLIHQRT